MSTPHLNNPAGRLWLALTNVVSPKHRSTDQQPVRLRRVLAAYFGVPEDDDSGYYAYLSALMRMPVEVREEVALLDDPPIPVANLTRPLPHVEAFLTRVGDGRNAVHRARTEITDGVLNDLEACSHVLARSRESIAIDAETLDRIRSAAEGLVAAITEDKNLPTQVRSVMLRYAHAVLLAVDEYKIRGGEGVIAAWDTVFGMTLRNTAHVRGETTLLGALKNLGLIIGTVVTVASAPEQIASGVGYVSDFFELPTATEAPGR